MKSPDGTGSRENRIALGSVGALILDYRRSPEFALLRPRSKQKYLFYLRDLEAIHYVKAADVRRVHLIKLRNLIANSRGNGTAQTFISVVSAVFGWAVENELLQINPALRIKSLPGGHFPAWTADQADFAERRFPEHLRRVMVLGRHTGQRRADLCAMTWAAYDGTKIRLRQMKTNHQLVLPCPAVLRAELDAWKATATSTFILTSEQGRPWRPTRMSQVMLYAVREIGLPPGLNVHGLRKLAAASLAEAGCTTHEIAAVTGHRSLAMVQLYTESAQQERLASAAILRLEDVRNRSVKDGS